MNMMFKTITESKEFYTHYVNNHIANVGKAFEMFGHDIMVYRDKLLSTGKGFEIGKDIITSEYIANHDASKFSVEEFDPYRRQFYCSDEDFELSGFKLKEDFEISVKKDFDRAWTHHFSVNKHHPEYWCTNISGEEVYSSMPTYAFVEMICDWISVSMTMHNSTSQWWFENRSSGRQAKLKQLALKEDIEFIDKFMTENEKRLNFGL